MCVCGTVSLRWWHCNTRNSVRSSRFRLVDILIAATAGAAGGGSHMKLATTLFQNLFTTLNVTTVRLASCQVPPALPSQTAAAGSGVTHSIL
jgi:hypothetical protein